MKRYLDRQTLLIDADDTLWENNIYFEKAIAAFISLLDHTEHTAEEVRFHLNHCERETIHQYGYGLKSFRRSLIDCFELLSAEPISPQKHAQIVEFTETILTQQIELLPSVEEALAELADRHRLLVVTKGDDWEQRDKLARSGLQGYFSEIEVLPEKHSDAYRMLHDKYGCHAPTTWMIGNSPRSDINPALEAGLNAVFIPHKHTWVLEHEEVGRVSPGQILLEVESFSQLTEIF